MTSRDRHKLADDLKFLMNFGQFVIHKAIFTN